MPDIKGRVRSFIADNFFVDAQEVALQDGDSLMARHVVDSTGFLELVMFIEQTFGVRVEDVEMAPENLDSLDNIEAFVRRKLAS